MAGQTQDVKKVAVAADHDAALDRERPQPAGGRSSGAQEGDGGETRATGNWQLTTGNVEDVALFRRAEAELTALQAEIRARLNRAAPASRQSPGQPVRGHVGGQTVDRDWAEGRGPHGRRLARLETAVEDARLQAREGVHEAHYGQGQEL